MNDGFLSQEEIDALLKGGGDSATPEYGNARFIGDGTRCPRGNRKYFNGKCCDNFVCFIGTEGFNNNS